MGMPYPYAAGHHHESVIPSLAALHYQLLATCVHIVLEERTQLWHSPEATAITVGQGGEGGGANDCLMFEEFRALCRLSPRRIRSSCLRRILMISWTGPRALPTSTRKSATILPQRRQVCVNWDWAAKLVLSAARVKSI